jgi:hypothetical protein
LRVLSSAPTRSSISVPIAYQRVTCPGHFGKGCGEEETNDIGRLSDGPAVQFERNPATESSLALLA